MAGQAQYEELARQLSAVGAVKRDLGRILPHDCSAARPYWRSSAATATCA